MRVLAGEATRFVLLLLVLEAILTTVAAQLLEADECEIRYQYRPPPEVLKCKPNIDITRLECLVARPSTTPINTRVEVRWYWRSLTDTNRGSNTAVPVENSLPYVYVNASCNRMEICPTPSTDNLTVEINKLEIRDFGSAFEGDYLCRILVINETSGRVEQELQPSACVRLLLAQDQTQNCDTIGERTAWTCADTPQLKGECPQQVLLYPLTSVPAQISPSTSFVRSTSASNFAFSAHSDSISPTAPITTVVPTSSQSGTPKVRESKTASSVYISVGAVILVLIAGVAITLFIVTGMQYRKHKKLRSLEDFQNESRAPTYVDTELSLAYESSSKSENGDDAGSGTALKRNSTIYSKPVWQTEQKGDKPKDHNYAQPVTLPVDERPQDTGEYSYAYQHHKHPQQQSERMDKGNKGYQQLGMGDYMHMYSKPSPLLVRDTSRANAPSVEKREDEQ